MPTFGPISLRVLIQGLRAAGFSGPFPGGKHQYMVKEQLRITIPNPHIGDISVALLTRILRQAGIDRATWESL